MATNTSVFYEYLSAL